MKLAEFGWRSRPAGTTRTARPVLGWVLAVCALALVGTLGYMLLEGWSFLDSLYMAVTTMTTVGFREVHELDLAGRIWTMLMALSAIGVIFGTVGVVAENVMADVASGQWQEKGQADEAEDRPADRALCCVRLWPGRRDGGA